LHAKILIEVQIDLLSLLPPGHLRLRLPDLLLHQVLRERDETRPEALGDDRLEPAVQLLPDLPR